MLSHILSGGDAESMQLRPTFPPFDPSLMDILDLTAKLAIYRKIFNLILAILIIVVNSFAAIFYVVVNLRKKKIVNYILLNQALVDFCVGIAILLWTLPWYTGSLLWKHWMFRLVTRACFDYTVFLALGSLMLTSIERLIALKCPLYHRTSVTKQRIFLSAVVTWIISAIPPTIFLLKVDARGHTKSFLVTYRTFTYSTVLLGIVFVLSILFSTMRVIKKSMREEQNIIGSATSLFTGGRKRGGVGIRNSRNMVMFHRRETKLVTLFLTMSFVYIITYVPTALNTLIYDISNHEKIEDTVKRIILEIISTQLYVMSALFNPVFTLIRKDDFHKEVRRLLWRRNALPAIKATQRSTIAERSSEVLFV